MINKMLYHVCLLPAKEDKLILENIIKSLAEKYYSYPFLAHMTIYSRIPTSQSIAIKAVEKSLSGINPFQIEVDKLDYSDLFTKTLYIQFKNNPTLKKIYSSLFNNLNKYVDYTFNPHMSLIYKNNMPVEEKKKVISALKLKSSFIIDRCVIISATKLLKEEKDVTDWQIAFERDLNQN